MGSNVFGTPITTDTLEGMPEYAGKTITAQDRAQEALKAKNDGTKDVNARTYVENLKRQYGNGISTLAMVYNATGDPVRYVTDHDYHGHIYSTFYPTQIQNGQWGAFLHVHPSGAAVGSAGAVVYHGKNNDGRGRDWMLGWSIPYIGSNHAYTEIRRAGHFDSTVWEDIDRKMGINGRYYEDYWGGCVSTASIGEHTSPTYEATMTLEDNDDDDDVVRNK